MLERRNTNHMGLALRLSAFICLRIRLLMSPSCLSHWIGLRLQLIANSAARRCLRPGTAQVYDKFTGKSLDTRSMHLSALAITAASAGLCKALP